MDKLKDETDIGMIEELAEALVIGGTVEEKFDQLKKLSSNTSFENATDMCLVHLQQIIYALRNIYGGKTEEDIIERHPNLRSILTNMNDLNKHSISSYNTKEAQESLKLFGQREKRENCVKEIAEGINKIFNKYCSLLECSYKINSKSECYLAQVAYCDAENKAEREYKLYSKRVERLCSESKQIIQEYIKYAPKKFGQNLKYVMNKQNMSEQDIAMIMNVKVSDIQSLKECEIPKRKKEDIVLLCKALLISEDVLYKGIGKLYGNWKVLLGKEGVKSVQKLEKTKSINSTKEFIRKEINELINMPDSKFQEMIKDNPVLFHEEQFNLTEKECFMNLLHRDEAYTVLEILEKRE